MKKKITIIGSIVTLTIVVSVILIVLVNGKNNKETVTQESKKLNKKDVPTIEVDKSLTSLAEKYFDFIINNLDYINNRICYCDIDFDKEVELVYAIGYEVGNSSKPIEYEIFKAVDDEIKSVKKLTAKSTIFLLKSKEYDRYFYGYRDVNDYSVRVIEKDFNISKHPGEYENLGNGMANFCQYESNLPQIKEAVINLMTFDLDVTKVIDYDFAKTYEMAQQITIQPTENEINKVEVADEGTNKTSNNQYLRDVAKIGDLVNYKGSSNEWKVLNIEEYSSKGGMSVKLISVYGTTRKSIQTGGSLQKYASDPPNEDVMPYYDRRFASHVSLIPGEGEIIKSCKAFNNLSYTPNSTVQGDLYVIPVGYWIWGHQTGTIDEPISFINDKGEIRYSYSTGGEYYLRPTIYLKPEVKTSGKDSQGAWTLVEE